MTTEDRIMFEDREPHETDPYGDLFEGIGDWLVEQLRRRDRLIGLRLKDYRTLDLAAAVEMRRAA